jgi:hypothetical protein
MGITESGPINNAGNPVTNAYTLQLNTNFFTTTVCAGHVGCLGWEQFVFENDGTSSMSSAGVYIQYWLIGYGATCPDSTWIPYFGDCYKNDSAGMLAVPTQPVSNLANLTLSGSVTATSDSVSLSIVGTPRPYMVSGDNAVLAAGGWTQSEFGVYGDAGGGMATFSSTAGSPPAALTVRTRINYGGVAAPLCAATGTTGETNSLTFGTAPPMPTPPGPAVIFIADTIGGGTANCVDATTIGDVHAHTVAGLLYDFQATGDFELAQVGANFEVQSRQISGAPRWPLASVNQAIGTRMGKDKIAVCSGSKLFVNGSTVQLANGTTKALPSGVDITLTGAGDYVITDLSGNSVIVTPETGYLNVSVGVGTWPTTVRGLLGNPNNDVHLLQASNGTTFTVPLTFNDLYHNYGDTWREPLNASLLAPCGNPSQLSDPSAPFFASNLDPTLRTQAQTTCQQYGVASVWLNTCTLDVAVLGPTAAKTYVGAPPPVLNGNGNQ